jgi:hypothetical protein
MDYETFKLAAGLLVLLFSVIVAALAVSAWRSVR